MELENQKNNYCSKVDTNIRFIQENLNKKYGNEINSSINCDGVYNNNLNQILIYSLQRIEGFPPRICTNSFIEGMKNRLPILTSGESSSFVELLQYGLYCNGYKDVEFTGIFDENTEKAVLDFNISNNLSKTKIVIPRFWELLLAI